MGTPRRKRKPKRTSGYKSGLEEKIAKVIGKDVKYETDKLKYTVEHTYNPDFTIGPSVYIEGKGVFKAADRAKHLYIRQQCPTAKVFFVFGNPNNRLSRVSKTTYAEWCDKHGFQWCSVEDFDKKQLKKWENYNKNQSNNQD